MSFHAVVQIGWPLWPLISVCVVFVFVSVSLVTRLRLAAHAFPAAPAGSCPGAAPIIIISAGIARLLVSFVFTCHGRSCPVFSWKHNKPCAHLALALALATGAVAWLLFYCCAFLLVGLSRRCLELVELLAMFAPGDVPDALPEIMPFVQVSVAAVFDVIDAFDAFYVFHVCRVVLPCPTTLSYDTDREQIQIHKYARSVSVSVVRDR